jgi:hypothetical protein
LAARLTRAAEDEAVRSGFRRLLLHVRIGLLRNRGLFARLGYAEVGFRAHPGCQEPTFVVMEKQVG